MDQKSRAELFAQLERDVLASIENSDRIARNLNESFDRSERRKRQIEADYRQRRLERLLRNKAM